VVWLNPAVLFALAALLVPVVVHLLVHRRAEPLPFPTLRFLKPTRLTSLRRHVLDDLPLLLVRCGALAAAVAALAGPLVVTSARRDAWNRRLVRAVILGSGSSHGASDSSEPAYRTAEFSGSLRESLGRAIAWLEAAPPARRELVVRAPLTIGSLSPADLVVVPQDVGIRFDRTGSSPPLRTVRFDRVVTADGAVDRDVTLDGPATTLAERPAMSATGALPIEVVARQPSNASMEAAVAAVTQQRVRAAAAGRSARLVVVDRESDTGVQAATATAAAVTTPWMADAVATLAADADLQAVSRRLATGLSDARFASLPWRPVAYAADGIPLVAVASSGAAIVVVTAAPPSSAATPILVRAVANVLADAPDVQNAEVVPIRDVDLHTWSRRPGNPPAGQLRHVDEDDRRWLWFAALALLAVEWWMRRAASATAENEEEAARVA